MIIFSLFSKKIALNLINSVPTVIVIFISNFGIGNEVYYDFYPITDILHIFKKKPFKLSIRNQTGKSR